VKNGKALHRLDTVKVGSIAELLRAPKPVLRDESLNQAEARHYTVPASDTAAV